MLKETYELIIPKSSFFPVGKWVSRIRITSARSQRRCNAGSWTKPQVLAAYPILSLHQADNCPTVSHIVLRHEIGKWPALWGVLSHTGYRNLDSDSQIILCWEFKVETAALRFFFIYQRLTRRHIVGTVLDSSKPTMVALVIRWLPGGYILMRRAKKMTNIIAKYCNEGVPMTKDSCGSKYAEPSSDTGARKWC